MCNVTLSYIEISVSNLTLSVLVSADNKRSMRSFFSTPFVTCKRNVMRARFTPIKAPVLGYLLSANRSFGYFFKIFIPLEKIFVTMSSSKKVKKIYFITSNKKKLDEVNDLLGSHPNFEVNFLLSLIFSNLFFCITVNCQRYRSW